MESGQTKVKVRFKVRVGVRGVRVRLRSCVTQHAYESLHKDKCVCVCECVCVGMRVCVHARLCVIEV